MAGRFQSLAGRLLVSHPLQRDEHFHETVVLLHSLARADGAMGVILNRPYGRTLGQARSDWLGTPLERLPLHCGGPVASDRMAFGGWRFAARGPAAVRYGISCEEAATMAGDPAFRLFGFVGYAGWDAGQLENELRLNAWIVCPFDRVSARLEGEAFWKALLAKHRPDLRLAADSPENPGLN
jgi:putative transcriptional regulator